VHLISRMPVILDPEDEPKWLQDGTPMNNVMAMLRSYPEEKMVAYPISTLVNSPGNNTEKILEKVL